MKRTCLQIFFLVILSQICFSQNDSISIWNEKHEKFLSELKALESVVPGLNEKVNTSVSGVTLNEFLRAIAKSSAVNISVDPQLSMQIINNFSDVKVADVLIYLCQQYNLELSTIGNIIIIKQSEQKQPPPQFKITYDSLTDLLSVEVENEELGTITKRITELSGKNIIPAPGLSTQKVRVFIQKMLFQGAIDKLAYSNNLIAKSSDDGYYLLEKKAPEKTDVPTLKPESGTSSLRKNETDISAKQDKNEKFKLTSSLLGQDSLMLNAEGAPVGEVVKEISMRSGNSYLMISVPKGEISLNINGSKYQDILKIVLSGSGHIFKKQGNIYVIGDKKVSELMNQRIIQMQYRAVDSVLNLVPKDLISDIETKVFRELNSIMLSGPSDKVANAERFILQIDRLVPVISIEVLIIDYNTSYSVTTGITAGVGTSSTAKSTGEVFPAINFNLNSQSINDLISRFNGFGWAKIGKVTPNFYSSLKAMENQGVLNIRSTPILSTLNGHQTKMSIGNTEYYLEEQTNIIGTQNPQTATSNIYKSVNAELSVIITPIVSGDDQITLEVEVNQSDFTERISTTAPPGVVTRTFKSQIRVKNEEMILLGGLEENRSNKTSKGIPFISRIPILKWIFASHNDEKSKSKLNIFIKPTIIS